MASFTSLASTSRPSRSTTKSRESNAAARFTWKRPNDVTIGEAVNSPMYLSPVGKRARVSSRWEEYRWATNGHPRSSFVYPRVARRTAFFPVTLGIVPAKVLFFFFFFFSLCVVSLHPVRCIRRVRLSRFKTHLTPRSRLASPSGWLTERRTAYNKPDRAEFLPRRLPFFLVLFFFFDCASTAEKRQRLIYGRYDDRLLSSFAYECRGCSTRPWTGQAHHYLILPNVARKCAPEIWLSSIAW